MLGLLHAQRARIEDVKAGDVEIAGGRDGPPPFSEGEAEEAGDARTTGRMTLEAKAVGAGLERRQEVDPVVAAEPIAEHVERGLRAAEDDDKIAPPGAARLRGEAHLGGGGDDQLDRRGQDRRSGEALERSQAEVVPLHRAPQEGEGIARTLAAEGREKALARPPKLGHRLGVEVGIRDRRFADHPHKGGGRGRRPRVDKADSQPLGEGSRAHLAVSEAEGPAEHRGRDVRPAAAALGPPMGLTGETVGDLAPCGAADLDASLGQEEADDRRRDGGARSQADLAGAEAKAAGVDGRDRARGGQTAVFEVGRDRRVGGLDHLCDVRGGRRAPLGVGATVDGGDDRGRPLEHRVLADEERLSGRRDEGTAHRDTSTRASGPGRTVSTAKTPGTPRRRASSLGAVSLAQSTLT